MVETEGREEEDLMWNNWEQGEEQYYYEPEHEPPYFDSIYRARLGFPDVSSQSLDVEVCF